MATGRRSRKSAAPTKTEDKPEEEKYLRFLQRGEPLFAEFSGIQKIKKLGDLEDFMESRLEAMKADFTEEDLVPLVVDSRQKTNRRAKENWTQGYIEDDEVIMRFLLSSKVKPQICWDGFERPQKRKLEEEAEVAEEEDVAAKRQSPRKKDVPSTSGTPSTSRSDAPAFRIPKKSRI